MSAQTFVQTPVRLAAEGKLNGFGGRALTGRRCRVSGSIFGDSRGIEGDTVLNVPKYSLRR